MITRRELTRARLGFRLRAPTLPRMDLDANALLASLFVSLIGGALLMYGRKQVRVPHMVCGLVLAVFPYFVSSALPILGIGAALLALLALVVRLGW